MLTARGEDIDRIVGLELGADDYVSKPCNPRELAARLRAVLRRSQPSTVEQVALRCGDVELQPASRSVRLDGNAIELTGAEFDVRSEEHTSELQSLMRNSYAVLCLKTTTQAHVGYR